MKIPVWPRTMKTTDAALAADWAAVDAARHVLGVAATTRDVQFPKELLEFLYDMLRPLTVSASPLPKASAEPGPRTSHVIDILKRQPSVPMAVALEVALWADELHGDFSAREHGADDLATHFATSSSLGVKGRTMFNLVRACRSESILELGTAYGISGMFMLRAQERCKKTPRLTTVEGFSPQKEISAELLSRKFGSGVSLRHGLKSEVIPALAAGGETFDLLFHDGGHVGDAYVDDFLNLAPVLRDGAVVVYDDIRFDQSHTKSRRSCYEGWLEVASHPRVRSAVELDLNIGLIELA
jgi:predicted O-methyltransferase YrrM